MLKHFPQAVPEIPVSNVDAAARYYVDALGFGLDWGGDEGGIGGISQGDLREFRVTDADGNQLRVCYGFSRDLKADGSC